MILFLFSLVLTGVGLYGLVYAANAYRRYRYAVDLPTSTVQAAAVGLTEAKGRAAAAGETITAPFTERPCLLCHYICVHGQGAGDDDCFVAGTLGVPFYLEDETGCLLVRPDGAEIKLPDHLTRLAVRFLGGSVEDDSQQTAAGAVERFLAQKREGTLPELRSGRGALLEFMGSGLAPVAAEASEEGALKLDGDASSFEGLPRFIEARLEEGDELYVLGHAQPLEIDALPRDEDATRNERNLVIEQAPDSRGSFWSSYASIFEIVAGTEDVLLDQAGREVRRQVGQGVIMFAVGMGCLALVLLYGCGG